MGVALDHLFSWGFHYKPTSYWGSPWLPHLWKTPNHQGDNNNVLLVKIEGPVWHTIYHHLPIVKGAYYTPRLINQPMGKGHLWVTNSNTKKEHIIMSQTSAARGQTNFLDSRI